MNEILSYINSLIFSAYKIFLLFVWIFLSVSPNSFLFKERDSPIACLSFTHSLTKFVWLRVCLITSLFTRLLICFIICQLLCSYRQIVLVFLCDIDLWHDNINRAWPNYHSWQINPDPSLFINIFNNILIFSYFSFKTINNSSHKKP